MLKNLFKAAALATAASFLAVSAQAADVIKIGQVAPKSGPLAGGATVTQWPNVELWSKQVNAAGGLNVGGKKMMVEIVEYDDKTNPGEHIKAAQRLAEVDKVVTRRLEASALQERPTGGDGGGGEGLTPADVKRLVREIIEANELLNRDDVEKLIRRLS